MLVLSRKVGQRIMIGDNITILISRVAGKRVTLGLEAPKEVSIRRAELEPTTAAADAEKGDEKSDKEGDEEPGEEDPLSQRTHGRQLGAASLCVARRGRAALRMRSELWWTGSRVAGS